MELPPLFPKDLMVDTTQAKAFALSIFSTISVAVLFMFVMSLAMTSSILLSLSVVFQGMNIGLSYFIYKKTLRRSFEMAVELKRASFKEEPKAEPKAEPKDEPKEESGPVEKRPKLL